MSLDVFIGVLGAIIAYAVHLFFRDRDKQRVHESKLSVEILQVTKDLNAKLAIENEKLSLLDEHTRTSLQNYKTTLVEVLKDMRELVKNTESERNRTAGVAAATLLRPGKRMPQP